MEKSVKQRIKEFCKVKHLTIAAFENACSLTNGYVAAIRKSIGNEKLASIMRAFPELSREWLLYGEGAMLKPQQGTTVSQSNFFGSNNYINGSNHAADGAATPVECEEVIGAPVISHTLARASDTCILERVEENQDRLEKSTVLVEDMDVAAWYPVRDTAMQPFYYPGDRLAICPFPNGFANPRPGVRYVVQTRSNGMFTCVLYPAEQGYRAHFYNNEEFPDHIIKDDDIVSIFRILMMTRI